MAVGGTRRPRRVADAYDERPLPGPRAALAGLAFAGVSLLARAAIRVYFGRIRVIHRERLRAHGAMFIVANHPAMWTDVLVLDAAVGRKIHFIAEEALFRPLARAAVLRLYGALPVVRGPADDEARARNRATFRRCRELFRRGDVVALFPEGVSLADRSVLRLKTGAARLVLEDSEPGRPEAEPLVLPVGIHYSSRTSFGSEVTVNVGSPVDLVPYRALHRIEPEAAVRSLTGRMHHSLRELILDLPGRELAAIVADLGALAAFGAHGCTHELERARRIGAWLGALDTTAPERFEGVQRHARAYRRARHALGVTHRAILGRRGSAGGRTGTGALVALCVLGSPAAAIGAALHAAPWGAGELIARRVRDDPARFSFGRIASGVVLFPLEYALFFVLALRGPRPLPPIGAAGLLAAVAVLGVFTLRYARWVRDLRDRFRLFVRSRSHARLVRRARAEQRLLMSLLVAAGIERKLGTP